jgi:hypothetical protein
LGSDEYDVGGFPAVTTEQFVATADTVDAGDRRNGRHHAVETVTGASALITNQDGGHISLLSQVFAGLPGPACFSPSLVL